MVKEEQLRVQEFEATKNAVSEYQDDFERIGSSTDGKKEDSNSLSRGSDSSMPDFRSTLPQIEIA
jgi:hypothetical protein